MPKAQRYPFVAADSALGEASLRPYLPVSLTYQSQTTVTAGLLDTVQPLISCPSASASSLVQFGNIKAQSYNSLVI